MNRIMRFKQAVWDYDKDILLEWHYWGFIDEKFVAPRLDINPEKNYQNYEFTGLKDRNLKYIYEGDILKLHCSSNKQHVVTCTIEWDTHLAKFIPHIHSKLVKVPPPSSEAGRVVTMGEMHSWCGGHNCFSFAHHLEVIGNIVENYNLLK